MLYGFSVPLRNPLGFFFDTRHSQLATASLSIFERRCSNNLQIPLPANHLFSHLYKTPGVAPPSSLISSVSPSTSRDSRVTTHVFSAASALFVTASLRLSFLFNSLRTLLRNTGGWPHNAAACYLTQHKGQTTKLARPHCGPIGLNC